MHFIQEAGFSVELEVTAGRLVDDLARDVERACWCGSQTPQIGYGVALVNWDGKRLLTWYYVNGDTVTLLSITSACP